MAPLMIALGGALGSVLRYGITVVMAKAFGAHLPFGTWSANVLGSLLLGIVAEALSGATIAGIDARLVLGVGVLGGFTTYSSFNLELLRMLEQGAHARAGFYLGLTVSSCIVAGLLGLWCGRRLVMWA